MVPKTQETLREAQTNSENDIEVKITLEKLQNKGFRACSPRNP